MRTWLAALAFPLAACATRPPVAHSPVEPLGWYCQLHYVAMDRHLWIATSLAADGTPLATRVAWRSNPAGPVPGIDMGWAVPPQGSWFAAPDEVALTFVLPRPSKPVSALLYADDVPVGQGEVFDPAKVRLDRSSRAVGAALSFNPERGPVPALHGARRLVLVTVEGSVKRAAVDVPLPDWDWVDGKVAEALPALDADAGSFETRCERESGPEI